MVETYRLTKIGVAVDQLDWSIRLLLDRRAYVPAISLAGAAEEILGQFVGPQAAFHVLKTSLAADYGMTPKEVADDHLNLIRNWIKHCGATDSADTSVDLTQPDLEATAILMIVRALSNLEIHDGTGPSELPRFNEWLNRTRPDLV
jgi:hypothetical protein